MIKLGNFKMQKVSLSKLSVEQLKVNFKSIPKRFVMLFYGKCQFNFIKV